MNAFRIFLLAGGLGGLDLQPAAAGLAEATDFGAPWTSSSYSGYAPHFSSSEFWVDQSVVSLDGVDAAEGRVRYSDAEDSWITTTVNGPTTLYFSYRAESTGSSYGGTFSVTSLGTLIAFPGPGESFTMGWKEAAVVVPTGQSTISWRIHASRGALGARVYVDQVWTSDDPRPRITDAADQAGLFNTPFTWKVPVNSATAATLDAVGLPPGLALDRHTHVISGAPAAAGLYEATLTATNEAGRHIAKVTFNIQPGETALADGLDAPNLVFTQTTPGTTWVGVTGFGPNGNDSARARGLYQPENGLEHTLSTTLNGPGTLSFWYRSERYQKGSLHGLTDGATAIKLYVGIPPSSPQPTMILANLVWTRVAVEVPPGPQTISWKPAWNNFFLLSSPVFAYLDGIAFTPPGAPQMAVERLPAHAAVNPGSTQSFDAVLVGGTSKISFVLKNTGLNELTGLATSITGANVSDFTVTQSPVSPVTGPNGSTALTVRFSPSSVGPKSATMRIASNDPDDNPFEINLAGSGLEVADRLVDQGAATSFSITPPAGATIQWRKDGVEIPGATTSTLTLAAVQPWQIGVYSARLTTATGSSEQFVALLGLTGVPANLWRGLVTCYPFDGSAEDACRAAQPAIFVNTTGLEADAQRGGVAHIQGKGYIVPPLEGEPAETRGPGGYIQIPRPPLVEGEPFTISLLIKEEGFSYWHGESLFTMGEGTTSVELLSHYWIGHAAENYGGPAGPIEPHTSDFILNNSAVAFNHPAWTAYTIAGEGTTLRYYRNGQLIGITAFPKATAGDFFIGRHWWMDAQLLYSTRLIAKIDDLRVYNRALTEPEVQQLYSLTQVTPPAGSFESWALIHGLLGAAATLDADPDRDGLTNWEEYCFGASPADGTQPLMKTEVVGTTLTLTWLEREGVVYSLRESSELLNPWASSAKVPTLSADQTSVPAGYKRMQVDIAVSSPAAIASPRFFRVEATKAP